ncbi:MAG TPA: hypothetical protein VIM57_03715, partial [Luteolibacter sp.]
LLWNTNNPSTATNPKNRVRTFEVRSQSAVWGACAAGRDLNAGYPFPDFMAIGLFLMGLTVIPLGVMIVVGIIRRCSKGFFTSSGSATLAILLASSLVSWGVGYRMQMPYTKLLENEKKFSELAHESYRQYARQIKEDPEIVLRERWFEWDDSDRTGAKAKARWNVFENSLKGEYLKVPYTVDQLRRIFEESPFCRPMVASHPQCPPELIEQIWPKLFSLRDISTTEDVINNPATPRHLLEEYQEKRRAGTLLPEYAHILDDTVEQRLRKRPQ